MNVFLDLKKAFDSTDHNIQLKMKLWLNWAFLEVVQVLPYK